VVHHNLGTSTVNPQANKVKLLHFQCYFVNNLQSTSLIDAFKIVTVLLPIFDPPTATLFLQLIQLINSLPLVFFCVFLLISETFTLFLIMFHNWETFTMNFAVDTEQPLAMSGSAEAYRAAGKKPIWPIGGPGPARLGLNQACRLGPG